MGRTKGDHDAKREEIAEAACQAILRRGLAQASLAEISREMGYTTGILRHYFADKEELLLFAKNLMFDRSFEKARSAAARHNGIEKLRAMAIAILPCDESGIDRYRLLTTFNGSAIGNPRLMKLQAKRNERHRAIFEEVILALQTDGSLPKGLDARLEACGIMAFIDGLADQVVMQSNAFTPDEFLTLVSRYIEGLSQSTAPATAAARKRA